MAQTTTTQISPAVRESYDRILLKRGQDNLVLERFAQKRPVKTKSGDKPKFRRYNSLTATTVPLVQGVNPTPESLSKTDVTAQIQRYGKVVEVAEEVDLYNEEPVLAEEYKLLGENWGKSREMIIRDVVNAGTNVYRAGGVSARSSIVTKVDADELRVIQRMLDKNLARTITRMVPGQDRSNTYAVPAAYIGVCSPEMALDLEALTNFTKVKDYSKPEIAYPGEFGMLHNIRFIMSQLGKSWADEGGAIPDSTYASTTGSNCDIHSCLILGEDAFGVTDLAGKAKEIIIKDKGQIGGALESYSTAGWKMFMDSVILNELWMVRYEAAVTA